MGIKVFGMGLVLLGMAHAAAGILELVVDAREDALLGLSLMVLGAALFLAGSVVEALETRGRGRN